MLEFSRGKLQTPLIEDQRIWYLKAPENKAKKCLEPELFALAREVRKKDHDAFARHQMPTGCEWKEVPDRGQFLINPESRLLCLTIDAGIGKTTAMIQAQSLRGGWLKGHLVIADQFDNLPNLATAYCGEDGWLVNQFIEDFHHKKTPSRRVAWQLIERKIETGQFSLIVDSLDQTSQDNPSECSPGQQATGLANFLNTVCPKAQCIVSGRPQSIQLYWKNLFARSGPWKFAQIDQFSPGQIKKFLGEKRAQLLKRLEADVISNPRMLEMILKVPDEDLPKIQTAADIYWRAIDETLKEDIENQPDKAMKKDPALFWFSLLAFESLRQGFLNGVGKGKPMKGFLKELKTSQADAIEEQLEGKPFKDELKALGKLNSFILHAVLNSSDTLEQLKFRDRSMQDFFAALWVSKYSCTADQKTWLRKQLRSDEVTDPVVEMVIDQSESQFFRLAAGMPADAIEDGEIWADSLSVVYESSQHRSTELIYRCWPNLLRSAGYSTHDQIFEMQQIAPTTTAQREVRAWVDDQVDAQVDAHTEATAEEKLASLDAALESIEPLPKRVLFGYLSEFPAMIHGLYGADKERIATEFDDGFVPVPEKKGAELVFSTTDHSNNVIDIEISAPFQMAQYQVTNELYALFFPASRTRKEDDPMERARCAAANINWYDAWTATLFLHGRLPSEDECRGRPEKIKEPYQFCFGNLEPELVKYALYDQEWAHFSDEVGQRLPWAGLYDMHGNVWEWCSTWYSDNRDEEYLAEFVGLSRCLRGGSFINFASFCRCALRYRYLPIDAIHYFGFRVARAE